MRLVKSCHTHTKIFEVVTTFIAMVFTLFTTMLGSKNCTEGCYLRLQKEKYSKESVAKISAYN